MGNVKICLTGPDAVRRMIEASPEKNWVPVPSAGRINVDTGEICWNPGFEWLGKIGAPVDEMHWRGMQ